MFEIYLHNPSHSGDILLTLEFAKIIINSNPTCKFKLVPASCKCLYNNLISENVEIINHNCIWDTINKTNVLIKSDIITNLHDVLVHYENQKLYINLWKMLVQDNNNCINLLGRTSFIKKTMYEINLKFNLNIEFNCDNDKRLIPILPDVNIDKTENYLKSLNKKFIFYYNLNSTCGIENQYSVNINDKVIIKLLSEIDDDTILLLAKKIDIQSNKIIYVESDLNNPLSNDGENLLVNEKISRLCDKIYFKINGGSHFILNSRNIDNEQQFYLINSENWYGVLKNSYYLKNLSIFII
jgi:hypothetical protein